MSNPLNSQPDPNYPPKPHNAPQNSQPVENTERTEELASAPQTAQQSQPGYQQTTEIPRHQPSSYASQSAPAPAPGTNSFGTPTYASGYATPVTPVYKKPKKKVGIATLVVAALAAGLIGGGTAVGLQTVLNPGTSSPAATTSNVNTDPVLVNNPDSSTNVTAAAQKAAPSVVTISAAGQSGSGTGSGIILDTDGNILTNTHVITLGGQEANAQIQVQLSNGKVYDAKVVGMDPTNDLAVIKIDAPDLVPATLGDSAKLNVGDVAIAIGAPLGLSNTVTDGIISTLNRTISVQSSAAPEQTPDSQQGEGGDPWNFAPPEGATPRQQQSKGVTYLNVIQTDAAINPGNSGGALVNEKGEVIGVNVAIASAGQSSEGESGNIGVGFAIPINNAKRIAEDIIQNGKASHGFLGVSVTPVGPEGTQAQSSAFSVGAQVRSVEPNSPASGAGLKEGDIITAVGDRPIRDGQELTATIREYAAGSDAKITFTRDGQSQTVDVKLGTQQQ
ncbi:trypsin-like peptidase domain-containing protein [Haematomicrobium sanguinis]|uniref:trypsin-like peptidase domain-containing protein n=1 Tax=Haematomicrobium sanguinis TaxID=479106 RepID=UPI00047B4AF7|nr:trypsin-like peptidase domain-containing protein [Haematomicrobium sanguinis]